MARGDSPVHVSEVLSEVVALLREKSSQPPTLSSQSSPKQYLDQTSFSYQQLDTRSRSFINVLQKISLFDVDGGEHLRLYALDMNRRNCKIKTIWEFARSLYRFLCFLKNKRIIELEQITGRDIEAFVEHEQDRGLKPLTVRTYLAHVHAFLQFLIEEEILSPEIFRRRIRLRLPQRLPRAMDPDDVEELLCVIEDIRDRAMVLVLLRTGVRIGELLETKVDDVNFKEQTITIWQGEKNRRGRVVYFSDDAGDALMSWLRHRKKDSPCLFPGRGGGSLTYHAARFRFMKIVHKAGLVQKGYSLHCLRHTFASEMVNAGMRIETLQQILGHDCIEMTRRYANLTNKTRREEYFRAMAKIEKGEIDGSYQLYRELQEILKEKELLSSYHKELPPQP